MQSFVNESADPLDTGQSACIGLSVSCEFQMRPNVSVSFRKQRCIVDYQGMVSHESRLWRLSNKWRPAVNCHSPEASTFATLTKICMRT